MPSENGTVASDHERFNKKENEGTKIVDSLADNVKEEMDIRDSSETISVTGSAPDAAKCQSEESLAMDPTVKETAEEFVKESQETLEEKQPKIDNIPVAAVETLQTSCNSVDANPLIESKTSLAVEGTENSKTCSRIESENESSERGQEEQLKPVPIYDPSGETVKEKPREPELDAGRVKETSNYEAQLPETEKPETVATKISMKKLEKEQLTADISEIAAETTDKARDIADDHSPKESDADVAKETGGLEAEKPEVEEKPREKSEVGEEVEEKSKDLETKEGKDQKEEEIIVTVSSEQVSSMEEAHEAVQNWVEISAGIAEKVVEEVDKKEPSCTHVVEVPAILENPEQVSINQEAQADLKENIRDSTSSRVEENIVANDDKKEENLADPVKELSTDIEVEMKRVEESNEAKTYKTEERIEKVDCVRDDNKKDEHAETMADEEKETLMSKLEEKEQESVQTGVENLEKQQNIVDGNKDGDIENKEDEVIVAVSEPIRIRETLASKLKEKDEESIKTGVDRSEKREDEGTVKDEAQNLEPGNKEGDAIKASKGLQKETPAKPVQKQSYNIISKVKQSLVKAKKAITGKSPSSKTISTTETKGDIKVK